MKKINLIYWNKDNFGDQLSPYIASKVFLGKNGAKYHVIDFRTRNIEKTH